LNNKKKKLYFLAAIRSVLAASTPAKNSVMTFPKKVIVLA
jgi:hypothetical protein